MKNCFLALALFSSSYTSGQKHAISLNYRPAITQFGKQSQNFHDVYFHSREGDRTFNHAFNILYSYQLSPRSHFATGVEYAQQGQNINFNADSAFPSDNRVILKTELNYLRMPFTIAYSVLKFKKSDLNIYSGLSLGRALKRKDNYEEIILEKIKLPPGNKRYKAIDLALPVGMNYVRKLTPNIGANFGSEYLIGLTNAFANNSAAKFGVLSEFANSKQNRFAFNLGISFNLQNQNPSTTQ